MVEETFDIIKKFYRGGGYGDYRFNLKTVRDKGNIYCVLPKIKVNGLTITEGVTKTYPTKSLLKDIETKQLFKGCEISTFNWNGNQTIAGHIIVKVPISIDSVMEEKRINSYFESYGYYLGAVFEKEEGKERYQVYQFEPLYQTEDDEIVNTKYLYHITTLNGWKKICKFSFCPKSNCLVGLKYPSRVYFFTSFDKTMMVKYTRSSRKQNKHFDGEEVLDTGEYVVVKVDVSKINFTKVQFFKDNNMEKDKAIFTYNNLSSDIIDSIEFINL